MKFIKTDYTSAPIASKIFLIRYRELVNIVIPFVILVPVLDIELSYILYACQRWKIVLAEKKPELIANVGESYWSLCWVLCISE
jgi:hypothetical protein